MKAPQKQDLARCWISSGVKPHVNWWLSNLKQALRTNLA